MGLPGEKNQQNRIAWAIRQRKRGKDNPRKTGKILAPKFRPKPNR
jgi:hypothetical protein